MPIVWRSRFKLLVNLDSCSVEGKKGNDMRRIFVPSVCYLVMQYAEENPLGYRGIGGVNMRKSLEFSLDILDIYSMMSYLPFFLVG